MKKKRSKRSNKFPSIQSILKPALFVAMNSRVYVKTEQEYLAKIQQVVEIIKLIQIITKHQTEFK